MEFQWSTGLYLRAAGVGSTDTMAGRCMEGGTLAVVIVIRRHLVVRTVTLIGSIDVQLLSMADGWILMLSLVVEAIVNSDVLSVRRLWWIYCISGCYR